MIELKKRLIQFVSLDKIYKTKQASKINNSFINIHSKTIL